jgi:hypothetical protein
METETTIKHNGNASHLNKWVRKITIFLDDDNDASAAPDSEVFTSLLQLLVAGFRQEVFICIRYNYKMFLQ